MNFSVPKIKDLQRQLSENERAAAIAETMRSPGRKAELPERGRMSDKAAEKIIGEKTDIDSLAEEFEFPFSERELLGVLARLVLEPRDRFKDYDTVLSDDASGRIISLILRKIIVRKKEAVGGGKVNTNFIAGGEVLDDARKEGRISKTEQFIREKKTEFGKTLLVTEYIDSGRSIGEMVRILEENRVDFDTATLTLHHPVSHYSDKIRRHLVFGRDESALGLAFYGQNFSGVRKTGDSAHPFLNRNSYRADVVRIREDAELIADELYKLAE